MKGIRCLEVVSNPAFLQHTFFFLFDSSLSLGPLGVEMIHFERRARTLMTIRTIAMFRFIWGKIINSFEMAVKLVWKYETI